MKLHLIRESNKRYELLKDIPGYEGLYAATKNGQIYSYKRKKFLTPEAVHNGYYRVCLTDASGNKKHMRIQRVILMTFNPIDNCEEYDASHLNEIRTDNRLSNLAWMSHRDNINYGSHNIKLSQSIKKKIYCEELNKVFDGQIDAAKELGISSSGISLCCRGKLRTTGGYHFCFWKENE